MRNSRWPFLLLCGTLLYVNRKRIAKLLAPELTGMKRIPVSIIDAWLQDVRVAHPAVEPWRTLALKQTLARKGIIE